jgi:YD repeat-containing protein
VNGAPKAISQITLPDSTTLNYTYGSLFPSTGLPDYLLNVQRLQGATVLDETSYDYGDTSFPWFVTGIRDVNGVLRWSVTYDGLGRATLSEGAGGADAYAVAYSAPGTTFTRTVTTPDGKDIVYTFTHSSGFYNLKLTSIAQQVSPNSPAATASKTYDTSGYIATETDNEGRVTGYTRDTSSRPTQIVEAQGTTIARTTGLTWHSVLNSVTQTVAPGLTTNNTFTSGTSAGPAPPPVYTASQTFAYTGAGQTYTVPTGTSSATIQLWGGAGGAAVSSGVGAWSGAGGYLQATFAVSPGDVLTFEVGGGGVGATSTSIGGPGGWPDGGPGTQNFFPGAGGGGSTRFYINGVLKAVSAGGGGSAGASTVNAGAGGGATGQSAGSTGGTGGSQTAGGVASAAPTNANKTGRSIVAFPGAQRTGAWGNSAGTNTSNSNDDGGGGGGGYWGGGGGGGSEQAGGGGSSWVDPSATSVLMQGGFWMTPFITPAGQPTVATGVLNGTTVAATTGGNGYAMVGVK